MTTRRQMAEMVGKQVRVITALRDSGDERMANRLAQCMKARVGRCLDGGRPWTCRSPGCSWCRKTTKSRWWAGSQRWVAEGGESVSIVVLPVQYRPGELRAAVARLRRACRDVRDRAARQRARWRSVAMAGVAFGNGTALLLIRHPVVALAEVGDVITRRWPDAIIRQGISASPCWAMSVQDAVELGRARRGVEPLRVVVLPQRASLTSGRHGGGVLATAELEPMPVLF
jgi:hypothetical protein